MRIAALDSLRGTAAFSVLLYHCLLVWPGLYETLGNKGVPFFRTGQDPLLVALLTTTPPSLLWSGREAVLLFFVLSGYVLALPFLRPDRPSWLPFVVRRACRLMLPCAAVVLPVALLVALLDPVPHPRWSGWVGQSWQREVTPGLLAAHALLLDGEYSLNNVLWTLHHEWRVALAFPLLVLLAGAGWRPVLALGLAGLALGIAEARLFGSGWLATLTYLPYFLMGLLLARGGPAVPARIAALPRAGRLGLWLLCYLLLTARWLLPVPATLWDLANGAGAALLIALILASPRVQAALLWAPLAWLGQVSFSLYLVHVPVILGILYLAPAGLPDWGMPPAAVLLSLLLAAVVFHLAERPSIWLGRVLARRVGGRHQGSAA